MTYEQVADMVTDIGLPCAYYQFEEDTAAAPPFICWYYPGADDLHGDNANYQRIARLVIELYTDRKDPEEEAKVEAALYRAGLSYGKEETYIDSEKMYMVTYDMEVMING